MNHRETAVVLAQEQGLEDGSSEQGSEPKFFIKFWKTVI
jgi:hypothetical protein